MAILGEMFSVGSLSVTAWTMVSVCVLPDFLSLRKGIHQFILDAFIQLGLHVDDMVPAGAGVI